MAAPTDPYAEGTSISTIQVWWDYSGSNAIGIYISTDGVSYSLNATADIGDTDYEVIGLVAATKYWFKLSDDLGATFSSVVTTHTHTCVKPAGSLNNFSLPRVDSEIVTPDSFNNMAQRVEEALGGRVLAPDQCVVCPEDGAIVIDCIGGCADWLAVADEDINSISINNCDNGGMSVEFLVPPNTSRKICGWPAGFGFGGDECRRMPFATGATGGSVSAGSSGSGGRASPSKSAGRNSYNKGVGRGTGSGGGGGGAGCTCTPRNGALTLKSCNPNNSLNCSSTKTLKVIACGGKPPYTFSASGSLTVTKTSDTAATVTPPTNTGSAVAGTAYVSHGGRCADAGGVPQPCPNINFQVFASEFGCDDVADTSCGQVTMQPGDGADCVGAAQNLGANGCLAIVSCFDGATCTFGTCDARSAAMIAAGCNPCGVHAGSTVSVTDALGVVYTLVLGA